MKIFVINGPNMNMLGLREPNIYGRRTYAELCEFVREKCDSLGVECDIFQSNHEGELVDIIQSALGRADGIIINPAAYTHTSVAILDALKAVALPAVEVHMSDPDKREDFRRVSYAALACERRFTGRGFESYAEAAEYLKGRLSGGEGCI